MELLITNKTIEVEQLIGERSTQALVSAETMVPGAGREAVEPLMEEATLTLGAAEVQRDRVVLDGVVYCQAMYRQGDESAVRALTATTTVNQVLDMPGVEPGMILRIDGLVEHTEAVYENGHMVFTVVVGIHAQVLNLKSVDLIEDLGGDPQIQTQYRQVLSSKLSAEATSEAVLREEVSLPQELDARISLMDFASARVRETVADLGGVRVRGEVYSETLIGTGIPGRPVASVKVTLPFDQLVELPEWLTRQVNSFARVRRMSTQIREGGEGADDALTIECELMLRVEAMGTDEVRALSDAYATGTDGLDLTEAELMISQGQQQLSAQEPFKGTLMLPEGTPGVGMVLAVRARPVLSEWSAQNGHTTLTGLMECTLLYLSSGSDRVVAAREEMPFSMHVAGELPPGAWINLETSGAEAGALMSDRMEIRCNLKMEASYAKEALVRTVAAIQSAGPQPKRGGILLVWPGEGDDLWSLGKRYRVSAQRICELNNVKDKLQPGKAIMLGMQA